MTAPNDEPGFYLRMIFEKLTELEKKLDGPTGIVSHEVRLSAVEKKLESSWKTKTAFASAAAIAALSGVIPFLTK